VDVRSTSAVPAEENLGRLRMTIGVPGKEIGL
jgi:hypothetical protein